MKIKPFLASFTLFSCLLFASVGHATWITALSGGSWGDPTIWDSGTVPGTNDFAEVDSPYDVTVDTNAIVQYIMGSGTVTMAAGSVLYLMDPAGANGTYQLADLDTSAPSNTVVFLNNPFWAKHQNYCNLVFSNMVTTNLIDFYNGNVSTLDPAAAMTISGDMTVVGKIKVQEGADFTIMGNLIMGTNSQWDCSSYNLTVVSNTYMGGLLLDLDAASGADNFLGNLTIGKTALGWNVSDVTNWVVGGSLTNQALIVGAGYGCINFNGAGAIAGKAFTVPTININGSYTIGTTITLTTNNPGLTGTVTFDIAQTNQIILKPSTGTNTVTTATNYYGGNLVVINSGAPPATGTSFKFFNAKNYAGVFTSISFPALPAGLSWVNNLLASGSIAVTGTGGGPIISLLQSGGMLTLSWDSTTYPGYRVQAQTNAAGISPNWGNTSSGTVSPYMVTTTLTNPPVFFRLINP
jgi:hypothetical protein